MQRIQRFVDYEQSLFFFKCCGWAPYFLVSRPFRSRDEFLLLYGVTRYISWSDSLEVTTFLKLDNVYIFVCTDCLVLSDAYISLVVRIGLFCPNKCQFTSGFAPYTKSVERNARDTKMTTRMPEGARRERLFSILGLPPSFFAFGSFTARRSPAGTPLTRSEGKLKRNFSPSNCSFFHTNLYNFIPVGAISYHVPPSVEANDSGENSGQQPENKKK